MDLQKVVRSRRIESLADEVVSAFARDFPPVDVCGIAQSESIVLAPGSYGEDFFGRIEYHPKHRTFLLFHPELRGDRPDFWQVRFSIAHELGHYYIPEHRVLLMNGSSHSSHPGFICDNAMEREADLFAAALLMPQSTISDRIRRSHFLSLKNILALARDCQTSTIASALRCVKASEEAAWVVLSEGGVVKFAVPSEECHAFGAGWIKPGPLPSATPSWKAARSSSPEHFEGDVPLELWIPGTRKPVICWEESVRLGRSALVLTLLVFEIED